MALGIKAVDLVVCLIVADWFERDILNKWISLSARADFTVLSFARSAVNSSVRRWLSVQSLRVVIWFLNFAITESLSRVRNSSRSQSKAALKLKAHTKLL